MRTITKKEERKGDKDIVPSQSGTWNKLVVVPLAGIEPAALGAAHVPTRGIVSIQLAGNS